MTFRFEKTDHQKSNKRRLDLLILEDEEILGETICEQIQHEYGFSSILFNSGLDAIKYLTSIKNKDKFPIGFLLDMNLKCSPYSSKIEQLTPYAIGVYLRNEGINIDNFSYMSGNFSENDKNVCRETGLPSISPKQMINLEPFLMSLAQKKLSLIPNGKIGARIGDSLLYSLFPEFIPNKQLQNCY